MQSLLLPVARTGAFPAAAVYSSDFHLSRFHCRPFSVRGRQASDLNSPSNSLPSLSAIRSSSSSSLLLSKTFGTLEHRRGQFCLETRASSSSISPTVPPIDEAEKLKLAQVLVLLILSVVLLLKMRNVALKITFEIMKNFMLVLSLMNQLH